MATVSDTAFVVRCSFCGLEETAVEKVIAGPGVYICNDCVGTCNAILEQQAATPAKRPEIPYWETMSDEQILANLPRIAAVEAQVEHSLREWVGRLRDRGVTWERIGRALGTTRQAAWEKLSGEK